MVRTLLAVVVSLIVTSHTLAGVVFEIETKHYQQGQARVETTQVGVEGKMITMEIGGGAKQADYVVFRGDRREMIVMDNERRSYMVMNGQTLKKLAGQINQALGQAAGQFDEILKTVPPEQRALIEQMKNQKFPSQQSPQRSQAIVRRLSDQADVYGYPCVLYEVVRDRKRVRNMWVTNWRNIEGGNEMFTAFEEMGNFFQEIQQSMPAMGADEVTNNVYAQIKEIGGFPVAIREYDENGNLQSESALRGARRQRIDPAAFAPPSGYKRQAMFDGAFAQPASYGARRTQQPRR